MHNDHENNLETRLDAAAETSRAVSPLPDAVATTVRRCGRVRRAKFAALSLAPIALAAGLMVMQFSKPSDSAPDAGLPDVFVSHPILEGDFPSLIGRREYRFIFDDVPRPTVAHRSPERVYSVSDAYDPALIEALFSGI